MKTTALAVTLLAGAFVTGCGSDSRSPRIRSFVASDTSLPDGGEEVTFTWDVKNATSLELLPFPGAVTGSSATVTVTEPTTFTLVAKRKSRTAHKSLDILVGEAFDVVGTVVNPYGPSGIVPVPGMTVAIGERVTITDDAGMFTFEDVVAPYDLILIESGITFGGFSFVEVFHGVTRPDPRVSAGSGFFPSLLPARNTTFNGAILGGVGYPEPNGNTIVVTNLDTGYQTSADPDAATYDFGATWYSDATSAAVVHNVLQYDYSTLEYDHARVTGTAVDGGTVTLDATLMDVPEGSLTIDATSAWAVGSPTAEGHFGISEFGDDQPAGFPLPIAYNTTTGLITVTYPALGNQYLELEVDAVDLTSYSSVEFHKPVANLAVDIPVPTRVLSPVNGAIVGPQTPFRIARADNQISAFQFSTGPAFGGVGTFNAYVQVYTDETLIEFPDLSAIGLPIPPGTTFSWYVYSFGPWASLDDALGAPGGHRDSPGDVESFGAPLSDSSFTTESGDDDDDAIGVTAIRYEPVPEN